MIGIDEVGRGCWAGPLLVVAARHRVTLPSGLKDSKLLNKKQRETFLEFIKEACDLGEGWVQPEEIDTHGLTKAMRLGVSRALIALGADFEEEIIMDGHINYCPSEFTSVQAIIKADAEHPIVSAASIYAKVTRDRYMADISVFYPGYDFERHVGYGTALHHEKLNRLGASKLHRLSFKPVRSAVKSHGDT